MQSYFLTITDMPDKYCGIYYEINLIQSQYTNRPRHFFFVSFIFSLSKVNIVAVSTILVLHVGKGPKMNFQGRETTRLGTGVFGGRQAP